MKASEIQELFVLRNLYIFAERPAFVPVAGMASLLG
jgi:hypothetical protein